MSRTALQVLLAVTILAVGIYMLDSGPRPLVGSNEAREDLPQTYLTDVRLRMYGVDGALSDVLRAGEMEYFAQGAPRSELLDPRFYSHDGDLQTWSASAQRGTLLHGRRLLELADAVMLPHDTFNTLMETEAMTVNIVSKVASSQVPVTITRDASTMRADQMTANLAQERVRMSNNVETIYVKD